MTRHSGQQHQETNNEQQQWWWQADNMVAWGSEETDNMDTDDPDFYFEGFVMHSTDCDCQQRFNQAIKDNDKEDKSEESDKEAATHT